MCVTPFLCVLLALIPKMKEEISSRGKDTVCLIKSDLQLNAGLANVATRSPKMHSWKYVLQAPGLSRTQQYAIKITVGWPNVNSQERHPLYFTREFGS